MHSYETEAINSTQLVNDLGECLARFSRNSEAEDSEFLESHKVITTNILLNMYRI